MVCEKVLSPNQGNDIFECVIGRRVQTTYRVYVCMYLHTIRFMNEECTDLKLLPPIDNV